MADVGSRTDIEIIEVKLDKADIETAVVTAARVAVGARSNYGREAIDDQWDPQVYYDSAMGRYTIYFRKAVKK
jgi:hypothetical protein